MEFSDIFLGDDVLELYYQIKAIYKTLAEGKRDAW